MLPPPAVMSVSDPHTFPASQVLQLANLASRWGIASEELLAGTGLTLADLESPQVRVRTDTLVMLSERTRELTGEPGIGFYMGLQKRLSMYGFLGFAAMSASTLREAIELFVRYSPAVTTALRLELSVWGDSAHLLVEEKVDLGSAHDIGLFSLLVGMRTLTEAMTGRQSSAGSVDVPIARPGYFGRFAHLLPGARFGQARTAFHFEASALDTALVTPDRSALNLAKEACEQQLTALGFDRSLSARVRRMAVSDDGFRRIDVVARSLHLSTRTLKRRLMDEGVTYSALLDGERHKRALTMVSVTDLPLEEVAHRLDYSSFANFARAFRRWTGESPAQYRRSQRERA
jgi:AraC-like DNA-binding protein